MHPFPLPLYLAYVQQKHKLLKQNRTKEQNNSPSVRRHRDVLFIFYRNGKLGELSLFGGGDLVGVSRVDFLSFPIYWQNEERRNIGFGNKEPITLNKLLFIYSNYH